MATRVIIVRHGQSSYNALKMIQGRCDESVLTDKGRADAATVGQALQGINFAAIYCSPLQRAKQTAEIIHQQLDGVPAPTPSACLLEINLPQWEKLLKTEVKEKYPEAYRLWHENPAEFAMTHADGSEHYPVKDLYDQAQQFWQELLAKHQGETVLIVAHNGINRCLLMSAAGIPPSKYQSIQQSNCCINVVNFAGQLGDIVQFESINQTAHLGVTLPSYRPGHNGLRLLLVRHGETNWNREGRFQGTMDIPLNENGQAQAAKAQAFLKDVNLDFAVTSPMSRPKETAEIILQAHPQIQLATHPQLEEIGHGLWEGKLESEIEADFPGMLQEWQTKPETVQMPEGENLQQVWDRANQAWDEIVAQYSQTSNQVGLVVAHDAINKVILCRVMGLQPKDIWAVKQGNCAVTVVDYLQGADSEPVLQAMNITSHLGFGVIDKTAAGAL
ncbi:histidine phosphatase family protein [Picosynechococcus sp. NKBG15041c]|uniref:histidine phosphatase family protein n=1 Tax=Picosynechococcus sp. NKBG15041c TaxID=1407650 RepID=UPI000426668A|nr:histidine phosphatase family protein [Picosynechococcus sp. NKBG15041c]